MAAGPHFIMGKAPLKGKRACDGCATDMMTRTTNSAEALMLTGTAAALGSS
jgi:hypothetical protein